MRELIQRKQYEDFLLEWKDKQIIKVVSGIRRCGKSTLLELYKQRLIAMGVTQEQIISINFEEMRNEELCDYRKLHDTIEALMQPDKMNYIFLDEIQHVPFYQKAVDSLFIKENTDIYITGSNAYFMSGELATLLSGRYVELKMLPLSFAEYCSVFDKSHSPEELYKTYIHNSSFPYTVNLTSPQNIHAYLDGIYNTVLLQDVVKRKKIQDVGMLESVVRFLFDNIGNLCTPKKIADTMTSMNRKISNHTVENYIDALTESMILYRVDRYDIRGKDYLQLQEKYYLADVGLRYYILGTAHADAGHVLENIVFLELIRRGYRVYVGKNGNAEVDFVAIDFTGNIEYYQVSLSVRDENTLQRELAPLDAIPDHYPKILLTMDNDAPACFNGIKTQYVLDWLLGK